ncbi:zinc finger protein 300-like isoform X1 [Leptopilina heterotoma]|uniref:zinc finger protein 300-like isoform X1 n=1 Tax=Leptopilina heterotoma TaxID=63436 RepID=UPI001CAA093F|nr:zinc finger protein 300-like isoform X1 [Leptopilina heterotoma]
MTNQKLCRLCADTKENFIGIYDAEGQKLAIDAKINKCLQIQVLMNDDLPLTVCIDCCVQLNLCSEFYEKTNKAQISLRQLLMNVKTDVHVIEGNIEYIDKSLVDPLKPEQNERIVEFPPNHNYITNTVIDNNSDNIDPSIDISNSVEIGSTVEINNIYFSDGNLDTKLKFESEITVNESRNRKCKVSSKKSATKQKRKMKKRNQKMDEQELEATSDLEDELNGLDSKSSTKIPDNYMTGTESDMEMIGARVEDPDAPGRKRGKGLDRYPWLCTDCNDKLPSLEALQTHHIVVHNQQAKYMCVQCCKVYEKYYGFLTHVKRHRTKSKYNCDDCGKSFVHKKVLESHKSIHSQDRPHVCATCGKSFRQQSALYIHSRCHLPESMKNRYECDQCDKRFSTKPNLVTHKRIHSGVRNFTCDQCGKSFIQKGNLEAHFLTHSADKPYTCSLCPKAFKTPLQLKKHETVHTGAKPHQCAVCGRTFREKGTLREHHRIHTGAMPFTCEFCGKSFRFKGILTTHRRQHTGERPYSCLECQHHFTNWPNYNKHMKRRHGINTSHTKHLQPSQQQQQQQQEQQQIQSTQITPEDPLALTQSTNTTVQVIQTVPHSSVSQPIVVQTIPTTAVQSFQPEVSGIVQEAVFRDRNTTYLNAVPTTLQTFLTPNIPYNFYNISNVTETDLIQHR